MTHPAGSKSDTIEVEDQREVLEFCASNVTVSTLSRPAQGLGGDFFGLSEQQGKLFVVIGDVCGRGAPAARVAANICPVLTHGLTRYRAPSELVQALNAILCSTLPDHLFVTALCVAVEPARGELAICNAGHVPLLIRRHAGGKVLVVGRASGPPLGMSAVASYTEQTQALHSGDLLLLMTDGVLEAVEPTQSLLTMRRMARLLINCHPQGAQAVTQLLQDQLRRSDTPALQDDATLISLEINEKTARPEPKFARAG